MASGNASLRFLAAAVAGGLLAVVVRAQSAAPVQSAEREPLAGSSLLLDIAMAGKRLVVVGERGNILLSDDRGASWTQAREVPARELLTGVCFSDERHGIAVGHDEVVLITKDAGDHWKRTHYAPEAQQPLLDVWCAEAGKAIAVGAYGAYYASENGGETWIARRLDAKPSLNAVSAGVSGTSAAERDGGPTSTRESDADPAASSGFEQDLGGDPHFNRIVAASATRFYIAGEAGRLFRSEDAGASWVELRSPYEGSFFGILPLGDDALLAYGLRGHLFRSDDAGDHWIRIETGTTAMLNDAARIGPQDIVIVGLSGALLESRDDGHSFSLRAQSGRKGLSAVAGADVREVVVAGEGGVRKISLAQEPAP